MIKLEHLRVFVAVAECGLLQEAASQLARTPAALSMTLKQLEADLGAPLFENERKSRLTPLGAHALQQAQLALRACDGAVTEMRRFAAGSAGEVKVAAVPSAATLLMPGALSRLQAQRPGVRVVLRDIDSQAVVEAVRSGWVDVGVATVSQAAEGVRAERVLQDPFVLVCPSQHPLARRKRALQWSDIAPESFIANGLCAGLQVPALDALIAQAHLMVLSTASLLSFVRAGAGVTLLPALAVPRGAGLVQRPMAYPELQRHLHVVLRDDRSPMPAAQALVDAVVAEAKRWRPDWA
jgi:DNA-binding transcriptional LysR family regulator